MSGDQLSTRMVASSSSGCQPSHLKPLLVTFHGCVSGIYGYAIAWQFLRQPPEVLFLGKFRYLTFQCLCIQFVTYSMCLAGNFIPAIKKPRDLLITSLAFPVSAVVFSTFWAVFSVDRELILPVQLEIDGIFPAWLNHICHTIILPVNLIEFYLVHHRYPSLKASMALINGYTVLYSTMMLTFRFKTGKHVYPFLDEMGPGVVVAFIAASAGLSCLYYFLGKKINDFFHVAASAPKRMKPQIKMFVNKKST